MAFAKKFGYPFPLLSDEKREIGMAYGACDSADAKTAKRITYVIGPDGKILKAYPKVSPAEHPEQILQEVVTAA